MRKPAEEKLAQNKAKKILFGFCGQRSRLREKKVYGNDRKKHFCCRFPGGKYRRDRAAIVVNLSPEV